MKVTFYRNRSDKKTVRKNIIQVGSPIDCWAKGDVSMLSPTIKIERTALTDFNGINYMYIDTFGRYYDIAKDIIMVGDFIEVSGTVDVLMSNANAIYALNAFVVRQENAKQLFYPDNELSLKQTKTFVYKIIGEMPNVKSNILTVDGGKLQMERGV